MSNFPNGDEEISLLKFISKYQYLDTKDTQYFFSTQKYYKKRISNLVAKKYLKRTNSHHLILDKLGVEFAELFNFEYNKLKSIENLIENSGYEVVYDTITSPQTQVLIKDFHYDFVPVEDDTVTAIGVETSVKLFETLDETYFALKLPLFVTGIVHVTTSPGVYNCAFKVAVVELVDATTVAVGISVPAVVVA